MFRSVPLVLLCIAAACRGTDLPNESAPEEASASQPVVELEPLPEPSAEPLEEYLGRRIARTMHWRAADWLLRENREEEERTSQLFEALAVQPGWTVCDLGAGNGYYSIELAHRVGPEGSILAVDIQPEMLGMLDQRARDAGIENIELIEGLSHDPRLPVASCDLVLMVDVYHELYYPAHTLRAIHRALKPGGRVVLVEYREEDPDVPIRPDHKMSKAQVNKELVANGFALDEEFDELPWQHVMFFKRASEVR
jgi:SAM-dependent methyltransferase